jgi:hypothetical protein
VHQTPLKQQREANSDGALATAAAVRRQIEDTSQGKSNLRHLCVGTLITHHTDESRLLPI